MEENTMDWSTRTVSESLDVKGRTINEVMRWYYEGSLIVNRKYQRKLVWDLQEKRLFIDSIINKYPTPSIIVSRYEGTDTDGKSIDIYEIIDGLQRLNAIVSFVNNDFGIIVDGQEYFYDLQFTPNTLTMKLRHEIQQKEPVLSFEVCQDFSSAEIPVILTTQRENRDEKIEKIFQRINSSGRKLSAHDIRQASSSGEFPDLVRRIATILRGDFTYSDEINLCDMPKISLQNKGLNYGINPNDVFWRRHDIIPFSNFRQSRDEELIASAMAIILLGDDFRINADKLNLLYRPGTKDFDKLTDIITTIGKDVLERRAREIVRQIDEIFSSVDSNFTAYLYPKKNSKAKDIGFITLFCALYRLNSEGYRITDYRRIAGTLKEYSEATFGILSKKSDYKNRVSVTESLYRNLTHDMEKMLPREITEDERMLEQIFSLSPIELQMADFKIGITYFRDGKINSKELTKIWQTLVAIANTDCKDNSEGYVIIGVANNEDACKDWMEVYKETPLSYGTHKIVGITREAIRSFTDLDHYELRLRQLIRDSLISEPLKEYVLSNFRIVNFHDKVLALLPSTKQDMPSYYDNQLFVREGTSTVPKKNSSAGSTNSMSLF